MSLDFRATYLAVAQRSRVIATRVFFYRVGGMLVAATAAAVVVLFATSSLLATISVWGLCAAVLGFLLFVPADVEPALCDIAEEQRKRRLAEERARAGREAARKAAEVKWEQAIRATPPVPTCDPSGSKVVIGRGTPFPLTILGVSEETVRELESAMDGIHPSDSSVGELVARTGLRCKEVDEFVEKCRPGYAKAIARYERKKRAFDEQADDGDLDEPEPPCHTDGLDAIPDVDVDALFEEESFPAELGRMMVAKYGFENLRSWCRQCGDAPRPVPEGHRHRPRCDKMVKVGLATWGPPMMKRGKTGPAFTIASPPELPVGAHLIVWVRDLARWIGRCETLAEMIHRTYLAAKGCGDNEMDPAILEIVKWFKVCTVHDDRVCPFCQRMEGKKYLPGQGPRPPFHLCCRCSMLSEFK
jgi:hypothetical protein